MSEPASGSSNPNNSLTPRFIGFEHEAEEDEEAGSHPPPLSSK
jgi:hypothetical protein